MAVPLRRCMSYHFRCTCTMCARISVRWSTSLVGQSTWPCRCGRCRPWPPSASTTTWRPSTVSRCTPGWSITGTGRHTRSPTGKTSNVYTPWVEGITKILRDKSGNETSMNHWIIHRSGNVCNRCIVQIEFFKIVLWWIGVDFTQPRVKVVTKSTKGYFYKQKVLIFFI